MGNLPGLPGHLAGTVSTGLAPNEPVAQYELGSLRNFTYLILDWPTKTAAIVDPQSDLEQPLKDLRAHGFNLSAILLTHTHHDHIAGVPELVKTMPRIALCVHPTDSHRLPRELRSSCRLLEDGERVAVGELNIGVLHTPGHSPGECCFFFQTERPYLLTGDTLFIRDCGRTDFVGGSNEEMFASLQKIKAFPPETVILPGHHYAKECASALARELETSPPLKCRSVQELASLP